MCLEKRDKPVESTFTKTTVPGSLDSNSGMLLSSTGALDAPSATSGELLGTALLETPGCAHAAAETE